MLAGVNLWSQLEGEQYEISSISLDRRHHTTFRPAAIIQFIKNAFIEDVIFYLLQVSKSKVIRTCILVGHSIYLETWIGISHQVKIESGISQDDH